MTLAIGISLAAFSDADGTIARALRRLRGPEILTPRYRGRGDGCALL